MKTISEPKTRISDHLHVPAESRDMDWLKTTLQVAIELEHSTLPLYLAAMFSLRTQNYTAYNLIRSIAMEEMVHMAIATNMLAAIGGTPQLKSLNPGFPSKGLPGGAEPDLDAVLGKVSKPQLKNFLRIEMPDFLLPDEYRDEKYPTISALYDAIKGAIETNADEVRSAIKTGGTSNQVGDDIGFTTITYKEGEDPLDQLYAGIEEILEQGEGATSRTLHAGPASEGEPSHYCRFAELYFGHRYQEPREPIELNRETEPQFFQGYEIPFPDVANTLMVPKDGYEEILKKDPDGAKVKESLLKFDQNYTSIMDDLDAMWNGPEDQSWPTFGKAVSSMTDMRVLSCFYIIPFQIPPSVIADLKDLYPDEFSLMEKYTDLDQPVFYGPRFFNLNVQQG